MRHYELALVLTEEGDTASKLISQVKGKITKAKVLGMRPFSYRIKKSLKGWYAFYELELEEAAVKELTKLMEHNEKILRYLLTRA